MKKYGYSVEFNKYCDHSEQSPERYGSWSESYSNSFKSIKPDSKYPDVISLINLSKTTGFLVWAEYSTGDSFGTATRKHTIALAIFENKEDAVNLKKALDNYSVRNANSSREDYSFNFKASDGQTINYKRPPWAGYFENLEETHIESVSILK